MNGRAFVAALVVTPLLAGCPKEATEPTAVDCGSEEVVLEVPTEDGLTLRADFAPAPEADAPAIVLLHMQPPANNRTGYPPRVRAAINALGVSVLNLDRRGAGESEGVAQDAYIGEGGLLDVEAAFRALASDSLACAVDTDRVVVVAASNGTTSSLDYFAGHDASLPAPVGMAWLSPGTYTQNQNSIASVRDELEGIDMLWLYPTTEPFAEGYVADAPSSWTLTQRGQAHGTNMFDGGELETATVDDLVGFIADTLSL